MRAYKFLRNDFRSGHGDEPAWMVGEIRSIPDTLEIHCCHCGYHVCSNFRDALEYAYGDVAAIVDVSGESSTADNKSAHRTCRIEKMLNVHDALVTFAKDCAARVSHLNNGWSRRAAEAAADADDATHAAAGLYVADAADAVVAAVDYEDSSRSTRRAEIEWQQERLQELIEAALA